MNTKKRFSEKAAAAAIFMGLIFICVLSGMPATGTMISAGKNETPSSDKDVRVVSQPPSPAGNSLSKGRFLVANRDIRDPRFSETVILLIDYGRGGTIGLVINRPTGLRLSTLLPEIKGLRQRTDIVYAGGPLNGNQIFLLVRARSQSRDSLPVFGDISVSSSVAELQRLTGSGEKFRAYAGYCGWAPGQLEAEVARGDWYVTQADSRTVFEKKSSEIWPELIRYFPGQWVNTPDFPLTLSAGLSSPLFIIDGLADFLSR